MKLCFVLGALLSIVTTGMCQQPVNQKSKKPPIDSLIALQPNVFNINNVPINVCFIKDDLRFVGFVIAGHADKTVCQIASLEVKTSIDKMGHTDSTIFSFGVGFDIRTNNWTSAYDSSLRKMEAKFQALKKKYPFQVRMFETSLSSYQEAYNRLKRNYLVLKQQWQDQPGQLSSNRFIVKYTDIQYPMIIPFFQQDSILKFRVSKKRFGDIPAEAFNKEIGNEIQNSIRLIQNAVAHNKRILSNLQKATDNTVPHTFIYYTIADGDMQKITNDLGGFPSPPDDFVIEELINNKVVSTRPITFREAVRLLRDGIKTDPRTRNALEAWIKRVDSYSKKFSQHKSELQKDIQNSNEAFQNEGKVLNQYLKQVTSSQKNEVYIDAFLRGWTYNSYDSVTNRKLQNWYVRRKEVWASILNDYPELKNDFNPMYKDKLAKNIAGLLHSENVFFYVTDAGDYYLITPYQTIGGNFFQIIDKNLTTPIFFTLNQFRTIQY